MIQKGKLNKIEKENSNENKEGIRVEHRENDYKVNDLRSAFDLLRSLPGQLIETDTEVEPMAECPAYIDM